MKVRIYHRVVLFASAFLICISLSAQTYSDKISSIFSFSAGVTVSNLLNDTMKYRGGVLYCGGVDYSMRISDRLNVALGLQYTGKGFKTESPIIKYRYYFLEIPLYAQIKLSESLRINAGLQYSLAASGQVVVIDPSKPNGVRVEKIANRKPADYGFLGGIEIDLSKSIGLGARYSVSGSTFFEKNQTNFGCFQLTLRYSPIRSYRVLFHK
jgi:hypothetical protein